MKTSRSEADVKREVVRLLKSLGILAFRMNTGMAVAERGGKRRVVRFGFPGMADLLVFPRLPALFAVAGERIPVPLWLETKSSCGRQSREQAEFQRIVETEGHVYLLIRSAEELWKWLDENQPPRSRSKQCKNVDKRRSRTVDGDCQNPR